MSQADEVQLNGWHAVPLDPSKMFDNRPFNHEPRAHAADVVQFPTHDSVVKYVYDYAKQQLPWQTFNHSMRVYYYATVILNEQFPEHANELSDSTLALTSLLHDLGTTSANMSATRMSFEFYGALKARDLLIDPVVGASQDTADAVFEAIVRHQDLGTEGNITFLGQIIQLATIYDNVGGQHPTVQDFDLIIHKQVREDVIRKFPRNGWLGCFAGTVREEVERKPWSHTTHIAGFAEKIEGNTLMRPYE